MKNYTQKTARLIARSMDVYRGYSESELIVITYGLELFLSSVIKAMIYIVIGALAGKLFEVVFAITVLAVLRKTSGGYHSKTDAGCLFLTGIMLYLPIILADYLLIAKEVYIGGAAVTMLLYLLFTPEDEKYIDANREKIYLIKIEVLILLFIFFLLGFYMNENMKVIILLISIEQGLSLIRERREREKKENERENYF